MENGLYSLPDGWRWETLEKVAEIGSRQLHPKREPEREFNYVALENVEAGTGRLIGFSPTPGSQIASNKYIFTDEHVLYGKLRPYLRKALLPEFEGVSATDLLPLKPDPAVIDRRFLWRWLLSPHILEYVVARQTGVKMPRLRKGDLAGMPVPVPPLPDQHRLVEKLERLLSQSRTAREALDRIPPLMKTFRQSVLAKAFRGELTDRNPNDEPASVLLERIREERRKKWEEDLRARGRDPRKAKYVEPETPDTSGLPVLPEGWAWASVGQVGEVVGGIQKTPARAPKKNAYPYLRVANVRRGRLDLEEVHQFELREGELDKWRLLLGDVLVVEGNGSLSEIGRCALWGGEMPDCVHQNHIIRVRLGSEVTPSYLHHHLNSAEGQHSMAQVASSSSGLYTLSVSKVKWVLVPLAPIAEQRRITARLEELLVKSEFIDRATTKALRRAGVVEQAVLGRAFAGGM